MKLKLRTLLGWSQEKGATQIPHGVLTKMLVYAQPVGSGCHDHLFFGDWLLFVLFWFWMKRFWSMSSYVVLIRRSTIHTPFSTSHQGARAPRCHDDFDFLIGILFSFCQPQLHVRILHEYFLFRNFNQPDHLVPAQVRSHVELNII